MAENSSGKSSPKELLAKLDGLKLSKEQLVAIRGVVSAAGLPVATSPGSIFMELPNGDVRVAVVIPADLMGALKEWASSAGEPLESWLQKFVVDAVTAYCQMDWQNAAV